MINTVPVNPGSQPNAFDVLVDEINGKVVPIYKTSYGAEGEETPVTDRNGLPVHIVEGYETVVNELFHRHTGAESDIVAAVDVGDVSVVVDDVSVFAAEDPVQITDGNTDPTFPIINAIDIPTNTLTLDRPLDYGYEIGSKVEVIHTDIRTTVGTLLAPVSHKVIPDVGIGGVWHLSRILISMTHTQTGDDAKFGDIAKLPNGLVLRAFVDGQFNTFTVWKTNGDIRLDVYDLTYSDKGGGGLFGTSARGSFSRFGVVVRLDPVKGDYMEVLNQDDLQGLASFFIKAQGHIEPI